MRCRMRPLPRSQPALSKARPKARADATPEQNTKISVASLKPKRAGIQSAQGLVGMWARRMMNIPTPRKKSRRGSRARAPSALPGARPARFRGCWLITPSFPDPSMNAKRSRASRGALFAQLHDQPDHEAEDHMPGAGGPGERDEAEEGGQAGDEVGHDVEREHPEAESEADGDEPPGQARHHRLRNRAGDEEIAQRIEGESDDQVDDLPERTALQPEHGLNQGGGLERAADARDEGRDHTGPKLPGDVGRNAGEKRRDEHFGGERREERGFR